MSWEDRPLGDLIKHARAQAPLDREQRSQRAVATRLGLSEATIGAVERGERIPALDALARLATLFEPGGDQRHDLLARWLVKWLERKVAGVDNPGQRQTLEQAAGRLLAALATPARSLPPALPRSLAGFPEQFEPLIAVFPDRREIPPDSPADLFIRSGAVTDSQYLPLLRGLSAPLRVYTDKFFVLMKQQWLQERFGGHNLLVVGSSGVNWLTRALAHRALFRPLIEPYWRDWDERYRHRKAELDDHLLLGAFWRLLVQRQHFPDQPLDTTTLPRSVLGEAQVARLPMAAELLDDITEGRTETEIIQKFRIPGFADPADGRRHGQLPGGNTDFGVVSLAPHPFDDTGQFVSIIVAGISGPATAHGLRALLTSQPSFARHPFGGVIRVNLPTREEGWPGRFENADWLWETKEYDDEHKLLANLRAARAVADPLRRQEAFQDCTDEDLDAAIAFVQQLAPDAAKEGGSPRPPSRAVPAV